MKQILGVLLITMTMAVQASKEGMYVGLGVSSTAYRSNASDSFISVVDDQRVTGWQGEVGHIWDLGKPGGFQMGVSGVYNRLGEVSDSERRGDSLQAVSFDASALTAYLVIQQVLAPWVDFVFKVGPSLVDYEAQVCCEELGEQSVDERKTRFGGGAAVAFTFYPTESIGIEIGGQFISWYTGDLRDIEEEDDLYDFLDSRVSARTITAALQYRF